MTVSSFTSPAQIMKNQVEPHFPHKMSLFNYFFPGWPENKEKCTNLFNYCTTYVDQHNTTSSGGHAEEGEDPFVVKVKKCGNA